MNAPPSLHPTTQTLSLFGFGRLDDVAADAVQKHLEQCPDCQGRVAEMSADSFLERVRQAQKSLRDSTSSESSPAAVARGPIGPGSPSLPRADALPKGLSEHPDYEIKRELGRGGMGVVYLAHSKLMGRDEVLKVMGQQIMERPGILERFLREIRAVAKLRHANIVTAYSAAKLGESIVFAMEYVEGLDLSKMVKTKGPLPVGHACNFVYQAALGLQHAHEEGLVHRDIKPANLMLSRKGNKAMIKILDFGLAKVTREVTVDGGLTSEGQALGTPDYMAPEQITDATTADIRADIYSLGCTLYYLLVGRAPFQANSLYDIYQAHISRDADSLNLVRPAVPPELAGLVAKMMAKAPARRFQTPGEVAQALTPFFKQANAAFKEPGPVLSRAGRTDASRPTAETASAPVNPSTGLGKLHARSKTASEPTAVEPRWESIIEFREEETAAGATPVVESVRRTSNKTWLIALAASVLALTALGVIYITIKDKSGKETKITVPDDSSVVLEGPSKNFEIKSTDSGRKEALAIDPKSADKPGSAPAQGPIAARPDDAGTALPASTKPLDTPKSDKSLQPAADLLQVGTVWKGVSSYIEPAGHYPDFVTELSITKRTGREFEGFYAADKGRHTCEVSGTITDDKIAWVKIKGIKGGMANEIAVSWSGIILKDRIDIRCEHLTQQGEQARVNGFFFRTDDNGELPTVGVANPSSRRTKDLLQVGSVWKGLSSYRFPASYPRDFTTELTITRREGNAIEGTYKGDRARVICELEGSVDNGVIRLKVSKSLKSVVDFENVPITGLISGDHVDWEVKHTTFDGQPAFVKGLLIRDGGTGGMPTR